MKVFRTLAGFMCIAVLMSGMALTAYAGGGDEYVETQPPTVATEPEAIFVETEQITLESGVGFIDEGNLVTRDLLYDKATNKQFISVQTSGGNTFYIVIDYDKPVDEADLLAAMEAAGVEIPTCSCVEHCMVGSINTGCEICATNMTECIGVEPEPEIVETTEPVAEPDMEKGRSGTFLLIVVFVLVGGTAAWYFKIYLPKKDAPVPEEEYEEPDYSAYADEDDAWDEEDNV